MKKISMVVGWLLVATMLSAAPPVFNISDFGAVGDGKTNNTKIIQRLIDSCSRLGGGMVTVPAGKFLTGTVYLKDHVELHLDEAAVLLGSISLDDYSLNQTSTGKSRRALLFAQDAADVSVTGHGTIDGQGGNSVFQKGDNGDERPRIIYFINCRNCKVQDITLKNAAFWVQYYQGCDGLTIRGIKVYSHSNWNNDGLDIDSRNVTVSDCMIDSDDDALCFKSESDESCKNITVRNCILASNCNGIKMGTASRTGFSNIRIVDCIVKAAAEDNIRHWKQKLENISAAKTVLSGIALEVVDGAAMDHIDISGIDMHDVQTPIFIRLGNRSGKPGSLQHIRISNITATAQSLISSVISGIPGHFIEDVAMENILITASGGGASSQSRRTVEEKIKDYPENRIFGNSLPAAGFYIRHAKNISFQHVRFHLLAKDERPLMVLDDATGVDTSGLGWADRLVMDHASFKTGDDLAWKRADFNDSNWKTIRTYQPWEEQGYPNYDGYAWYRFHFTLPHSLVTASFLRDSLRINLSKIDDADEIFLNGEKIGKNGSFPGEKDGFVTDYYATREYHFPVKSPLLHWGTDNIIAVRVYDGGGRGGITGPAPFINMVDLIDGISVGTYPMSNGSCKILLNNGSGLPVNGSLKMLVKESATGKQVRSESKQMQLAAHQTKEILLQWPEAGKVTITGAWVDAMTGKTKMDSALGGYILTPPPSLSPHINGAGIYGVRPGVPFLYKIPATGQRPLHYAAKGLPVGLQVDAKTGIVTGIVSRAGEYEVEWIVSNAKGVARKSFIIRVGSTIALTPPMGWNSWNCWGLAVSGEKVIQAAKALLDKGLADHGWNYVNIDDAWQAPAREKDGSMIPNKRFNSMKGLGDWLHTHGLKFGVYSSPGDRTCGRYLGSYEHEQQDAATYAHWGVDYLKYDWCSYGKMVGADTSQASYIHPYRVMGDALLSQKRDIVYSLCQYGMKNVWKWAPGIGGNSWRTTGDITDSWESVKSIGFNQYPLFPYAGPGHWNDPDMLVVGKVGWGEARTTRLTPDEQYTHISLWSLLSAPLLIGCDISNMDAFTLGLLTNDEVIALNQDRLGKQAQRVVNTDTCQVWIKDLEDGNKALGIFNTSDTGRWMHLSWQSLRLPGNRKVRDLWRQQTLGIFDTLFHSFVPAHGVTLVKLMPARIDCIPVTQNRDHAYNWDQRHAEVLALNKAEPPANVILGNSIVHYWGGMPKGPHSSGKDSWDQWLEPLRVRNQGFGWDKIENVLWRVEHGELDEFAAQHVLIMIGTNNLAENNNEEIIFGLKALLKAIKQHQPRAAILLSGLLPRRNMEGRIYWLNKEIQKLASLSDVRFVNPGRQLLKEDGRIDESFFSDGLHPNAIGYGRIAPQIAGFLKTKP